MGLDTSKEILRKQVREKFGRKIKELRLALELSQEELGLRIDADQAYISRLEKGVINPTLETITDIAEALKLEVEGLFKP